MTMDTGILTHQYFPTDPRLGRHMELDARSLAYALTPEDLTTLIMPAEHVPLIPILDQGNTGSCTGNAGTYAVAALYDLRYREIHLDEEHIIYGDGRLDGDASHDEGFAVELYHLATHKDGIRGLFPPDDSGSTGLGVCRALKSAGLISRYRWALSLRGMAVLLQSGGVMMGMPWYQAMFTPDEGGFIDSGDWQDSGLAGGHELYVEALESWDEERPEESVFRIRNSWGASWGDAGRCRMRGATYLALKHEIDVKQILS